MAKKLYHGASWYPELWSREILEQDILLMKQTGINVVRIGEFSWSTLEPEENKIDVTLYIEAVEMLHRNGIDAVICTPTATPPVWLSHEHPERMHQERDGTIMSHGSRQHACTNNPYFRERASIIIEAVAEALGRHPGVIGWQIDNELKSHVAECFCGTCKGLWHEWLEERYETITKLNDAWGTAVWSETYQRFDQVPQPLPTPFLHNSSLSTMHQLFSMEKIAGFSDMQAAVIRKYSSMPITHNSSVAFHLDHERMYRNLDFASYDTYASFQNAHAYLINCDLWRNFKKGTGFWVMETSPCHGGSLVNSPLVHPNGYLKAEAVSAYALGADAFCYWLWRQQRSGSEQPHGAILSAWGKPSVGYANVLEVEAARKEIEEIMLATHPVQAEVAITYSDRAKVFLRTETHKKLNHRGLVTAIYERFLNLGIHRDLVPEGGSLEGYKVLFSPFLPYVSEEYATRAMELVESGGIWVIGPFTGGRTEEHTIHTDAGLGQLDELAGVETMFTYPMESSSPSTGKAFGVSAPLSLWSAVFEVKDAVALGIIEQGLTPGLAFLTERKLGKGKVVMLGSMPAGEEGDEMLKRLICHYAGEAGVSLLSDVTKGTIVAPRRGTGYEIWVVVNMNGEGGSVTLPRKGTDAVTGEAVSEGSLTIGRFEHRVIRFDDPR
jgi:beta-galactosidase